VIWRQTPAQQFGSVSGIAANLETFLLSANFAALRRHAHAESATIGSERKEYRCASKGGSPLKSERILICLSRPLFMPSGCFARTQAKAWTLKLSSTFLFDLSDSHTTQRKFDFELPLSQFRVQPSGCLKREYGMSAIVAYDETILLIRESKLETSLLSPWKLNRQRLNQIQPDDIAFEKLYFRPSYHL